MDRPPSNLRIIRRGVNPESLSRVRSPWPDYKIIAALLLTSLQSELRAVLPMLSALQEDPPGI